MKLMWIKKIFLAVIGLSAGTMVAAGFFAFITAIGVVTTYAQRTKTAAYIKTYENILAAGAILGNAWWSLGIHFGMSGAGIIFTAVSGLCYGIFVGSMIIALAETIKTIPVFFRRAKITMGLPVIIIAFALGKCIGNLLFYLLGMKI